MKLGKILNFHGRPYSKLTLTDFDLDYNAISSFFSMFMVTLRYSLNSINSNRLIARWSEIKKNKENYSLFKRDFSPTVCCVFNCREKLFETSPGGKKTLNRRRLFQEISQKNITTLREAVEMFWQSLHRICLHYFSMFKIIIKAILGCENIAFSTSVWVNWRNFV